MLRGLLIAAICYYIDAVVWYNTPLLSYDDDEEGGGEEGLLFQRTWEFECSNGVKLERRSPSPIHADVMIKCELFGLSMNPDDAYRILKGMCDFMMTWSYALIWFTWESIVMATWIESCWSGDGRESSKATKLIFWHSFIAFTMNFLVYPISLLMPIGGQVRAVAARHMHDDERGWLVYAAVTNILLILNNVRIRKVSTRDAIADTLFCWTVGCFQAFAMVTPLYLFRIRPVFELSRLLYEVAFLMNRGSAEHYLSSCIVISLRKRKEENVAVKEKLKAG